MRLTDADALIVEFNKRCRGECCCCTEDYCGSGNDGCGCRVIDDAPTVDAEPVVRCKDCKYYLNSNEKCGLVDTRLHFYETDKTWTEDCFCSWGERRKDGKND